MIREWVSNLTLSHWAHAEIDLDKKLEPFHPQDSHALLLELGGPFFILVRQLLPLPNCQRTIPHQECGNNHSRCRLFDRQYPKVQESLRFSPQVPMRRLL